jgi:D-beta-D-heptose 7-phosphate kinase / D-beta-D-heptose 1-phosphate adenosyltransferase
MLHCRPSLSGAFLVSAEVVSKELSENTVSAPEASGGEAGLLPLVRRLAGTRILCIGDVMLDHYIYGRVERISPEAPVPVVAIEHESRVLGGAGNVARNLAALGARPTLLSVVGDDAAQSDVMGLLGADESIDSHLLVERGRRTTVKTRYIAGNQHLLRADRENPAPIGTAAAVELRRLIHAALAEADAVILSDYAKGVLAGPLAAEIIDLSTAAGRPIVVDPKGADYSRYRGATVLKPNRKELSAATGLAVGTDTEVAFAARLLIDRHRFGAVLVSLSEDGMMLVHRDGDVLRLRAEAVELFDVSGAGDTAVAALTASIAAGLDLESCARIANAAAGLAVAKVGTAVVRAEELQNVLATAGAKSEKLAPIARTLEIVDAWRRRGLKVGLTNGCFDLLHPGHAHLLREARTRCDRLVVALYDDASTARLKGAARPIQEEAHRAAVLASFAPVDLVTIFDGGDPGALIRSIRPDVLVRGADEDGPAEVELVLSYGGRVIHADLLEGHSTSGIIVKLNGAIPVGG